MTKSKNNKTEEKCKSVPSGRYEKDFDLQCKPVGCTNRLKALFSAICSLIFTGDIFQAPLPMPTE